MTALVRRSQVLTAVEPSVTMHGQTRCLRLGDLDATRRESSACRSRTRGMALRGVRSADPPPLPCASDAPTGAPRDLSGNADARTASAAAAAARRLAASDSLI
jgi:hypothetical protein